MFSGVCIAGNVPDNLGAESAYISYAIAACIQAKEKKAYNPEEYQPFALFIAKNEEMAQKLFTLAEELAKDLEISTVMLTLQQFDNEVHCELALQKCDLVFLTADGFNKYVKDELVKFENLKYLIVHDLDWESEKKRVTQFQDMFRYHDFPNAGERVILFFDKNYASVAEDFFRNDKKCYITFGEEDEIRMPRFVTGVDERDLQVVETEEKFEIKVTVAEKDAELTSFFKDLVEKYGTNAETFPRTLVFVNGKETTGRHVKYAIERAGFPYAIIADGNRKRRETRDIIENFNDKCYPVLVACTNLNFSTKFVNVSNVIFYNLPDHFYYYFTFSQLLSEPYNRPQKVISYADGMDYPLFQNFLADAERQNKPTEQYQTMIDALKPIFDALPKRKEDYDDDDEY
uniref:Helicase C-terminal domain-containing protein n=1 Tax=Panagrolaimus superbus TaxID=310955 RepID=A0A914ZAZ4_9BILA